MTMTGRPAIAVAILTLGVAGCGSSSSSSVSSSSGITPMAYRATVNKLCAANNAQVTALPASTGNTVAGLDKLLAIATSTLAQVKAVSPPSSMQASVSQWLGVVQQSATNAGQLVSAFKAGDRSRLKSLLAEGTTLNTQDDKDAKALGLASCAVDAEPSAS